MLAWGNFIYKKKEMRRSVSYHIITLVLKLKGVKKIFNANPIDYEKLRNEDVKQPKGSFYKKKATSFKILKTIVTEISSKENKSKKLLLFFPGGAFVSGPTTHHWDTIKKIYKSTGHTIWLCDYPKAPEHKIDQISINIDAVYTEALIKYTHNNIMIMGDSVGGTLSIALIQRLIQKNEKVPLKVILITPVLDASMSNLAIDELDNFDIMLAKKGVLSAKKMCAENDDLKASNISPIYGSFKGFPKTIICLATNDIMYADAHLMEMKLKETKINYKAIVGEKMPHIWPLLPFLKEGKLTLNEIITELK